MKKFIAIVEKTDTGYSAYIEGLHAGGVCTTGDTVEEIRVNILEALNLYYEDDGAEVTDAQIELQIK